VLLEFFSIPLTAAGFTAKRFSRKEFPEHRVPDYWVFSRGFIGVSIYFRGRNTRWDSQFCVWRIYIDTKY
jgi:hypothetical protein